MNLDGEENSHTKLPSVLELCTPNRPCRHDKPTRNQKFFQNRSRFGDHDAESIVQEHMSQILSTLGLEEFSVLKHWFFETYHWFHFPALI